ncbi:uncharacterized protein LOC130768706 [Actinidia eriantha]|uniref:uncharacterized protein LOC130768706 n=1 Tax=Actinidia eriantha TaxID=165200 RepID=UPI00258303B0|nr:uncharacterized protein LOC130768706 [Actinidia eriantha]
MKNSLLKISFLLILVVVVPASKVQWVEARVPEGCSTATDCDRLCGGTGDCTNGVCTCVESQKEVAIDALRDLRCYSDRDCQMRCAPVCYSKLCVDGKCQCVCMDN